MEGARQVIGLFLDRRAVVSGASFLSGCAPLSLLPAELDLLQLLILPLLLQAPQGAEHQCRLALDGGSDRGDDDLKTQSGSLTDRRTAVNVSTQHLRT